MNRKTYNKLMEMLGYSSLGFFDTINDIGRWQEYSKDHWFREGKCEGEEYSAHINKHLSDAAMMGVLAELFTRITKLYEEEKL